MNRCFPIIDDDRPYGYDGIERTCTECGEPLMVSRSEEYQVHVFHPACLEAIRERNICDLWRRGKRAGVEATKGPFGYCATCYHPLDLCSHCDTREVIE